MTKELVERLRELLEQARREGRGSEVEPLLRSFLAAPAAPAESPSPDVPITLGMVGDSAEMKRVFALVERIGASDVPVLIQGETGSGKELVARALHDVSGRKGAFLPENCAAVPAGLLESELFGHKRGSFTGAHADRDGHFVAADGGTLFLDEIGDMPLDMQVKLLRVLETHEVRPVGGNKTCKVDVRVVAATHRNLDEMVAERSFREDLMYRLNVVRIALPPLRERAGDVAHLVRFFLGREGRGTRASPQALAALEAYDWPGNVRQLENELRRALALGGDTIETSTLSPDIVAAGNGRPAQGRPG